MLGILNDLGCEYRNFNLNKINIDDEGMEDLETFKQKFKIDGSKCTLFDETKKIMNYSIYNEKETILNNNNKIFRLDFYLKRIISRLNKNKIKKLIIELGELTPNNFMLLATIKNIKSNCQKDKLVDSAVNIILSLINKLD